MTRSAPRESYPSSYRGLTRYVADRLGIGERPARAAVDAAVDFILSTVLDNESRITILHLGTFYPSYRSKTKVAVRFVRSWRHAERELDGPPPSNPWSPDGRKLSDV